MVEGTLSLVGFLVFGFGQFLMSLTSFLPGYAQDTPECLVRLSLKTTRRLYCTYVVPKSMPITMSELLLFILSYSADGYLATAFSERIDGDMYGEPTKGVPAPWSMCDILSCGWAHAFSKQQHTKSNHPFITNIKPCALLFG